MFEIIFFLSTICLSSMTAKKRRFQLYHFHCCKSICAPSLDKKGKHITSFTFTKIDSINVKNSIDKKKKCEDMYYKILYRDDYKKETIKSN